jgi:hypothetical protein
MPNDPVDRIPAWMIAGAALLGLLGIVVYVIATPASWLSFAALAFGVGVAAVVLARSSGLVPDASASRGECWPSVPPRERRPLFWLATLTVVATVLTAVAAGTTGPDRATDVHVARLWLFSLASLLLAAWWRPPGNVSWRRPSWRAVLPWLGMIAIAALPRLVMLDRFSTVLSGDEGSFMVTARLAQRGELEGLFRPGFLGNPNLYPAVSGYLANLASSPPADYRLLSAFVGILGVLATWRLGRYLLGSEAAIAGAVILATMPLNLHFSRNALNNISDAAVIAGAMLFLMRAVSGGRRLDAVLSGVVLGLGMYGYFGGRVALAVLLVSLAILTLGRRVRPREAVRIAGWMIAGFVVTAMPLLMAFRANPAEFGGRLDQVSPFTRDALAGDPGATVLRYLENARAAALAPWAGTPGDLRGFFMHRPPLLGWPLAILLAIGAAACAVRVFRDRDMTLLAAIVAPAALLSAGVALTVPIAAQRLLALTPLWALTAGFGLIVVARWAVSLARPAGLRVTAAVIAVTLVAMAATDLRWVASEDRQIETYGDYRTIMMWDIGWRVDHAPDGAEDAPEVLFAGPPYVFTGGFNSLVIQAPELAMRDVVEPLGTAPAPPLPAGSMLVIVPERQAERCAAERLYPDATVAEGRDRRGTLLYIALYPGPLRGWSTAETPAETTFGVVADSPCD